MAILIDNTGQETLVTVADVVWTKAQYSSYTNYRTLDGRLFVGQGCSKWWHLSIKNAAGEFDTRSRRPELFSKAEEAMRFAASLEQAAA